MPLQTFSLQQVQAHSSADSCWVIHNNNVYNVTSFVADHPGGEDYILDHAGADITALMHDHLAHLHSDRAYDMLQAFLIGSLHTMPDDDTFAPPRLRSRANTTQEQQDIPDYLKPTDLAADRKTKFLDLSLPLLHQLWTSDFSKAFYLEQVHIPRHLPHPARIFASPYLEVFTKTPWYVIPIFWLPIIAFNVYKSLEAGQSQDKVATFFLSGMFLWTLAEYVIHRFLFHLDDLLPDSTVWLTAHFLLHGIHHYIPMDRLRLVMPPVLAVVIATPLNKLAHTVFEEPAAYAVMAGALFGYVLYDLTHYYLHHAKVFKIHFQEMKTYHLAHHYKNFEGGYGITSKIWDRVFNTELKL
ncbi:fatty acid alpha-hydroxylase [Mortierella sp. NVP85]|nr:fatty acid alpha-hydroxylase [Mortierella sp. NVP85]